MAHKKIRAAAVFIAILAVVGGISWAIVTAKLAQANEQQPQPTPKLATQEDIRDEAIAYIKANHTDADRFLNNLSWTGGRQNTNLLGAETYIWQSQGWNVTMRYPVVAQPTYKITADYSPQQTPESIGIPYRIVWEGIWQDGTLTETSYTFSQ
jgi:hypothetical protein